MLLLLLLLGAGCDESTSAGTQRLVIDGRTFHLELAVTPQQTYRGLSDRAEIAADGGMLFVFRDARVREFVMRNCLVPIDIIFLDPGGRVVASHAMKVEPYGQDEDLLTRYSSGYPAQFAIELKGGTLGTFDIRPGDKIDLPAADLKRLAR